MTLDDLLPRLDTVLAGPLSDSSIEPPTSGAATTGGSIVIRIGMAGSYSMQILAESSTEEEVLRERLAAAWPAFGWIQRTIQAGIAESGRVGG